MGVGIIASAVATGTAPLIAYDPCDNFTYAPWTAGGSAAVTASGQTGNGFSLPAASTNTVTYNLAAPNQTDTLTVGFHVKFTGLGATATTLMQFKSDAGVTAHNPLRADTSGRIYLYRGSSPLDQTATGIVTTGTWYFIEVSVKLGDAPNGRYTVKLDGSTMFTSVAADTKNAGTKTVYDQLVFFGQTSQAITVDNIYLRNDATFMGPP